MIGGKGEGYCTSIACLNTSDNHKEKERGRERGRERENERKTVLKARHEIFLGNPPLVKHEISKLSCGHSFGPMESPFQLETLEPQGGRGYWILVYTGTQSFITSLTYIWA